MPELTRAFSRWTRSHSTLALVSVALSLRLGSPAPTLGVGFVSLAAFFLFQRSRGLANWITAMRALLVVGTMCFFWRDPLVVALAAFASFALDGVDGYVARRRNEASVFGAHFDMETDSFTVLLLCLVLVFDKQHGAWVLIAGALRYAYVVMRALSPWAREVERRSSSGRWIYFLSVSSLLIACAPVPRAVQIALLALSVASLCGSFSTDFRALAPSRPVMNAPSSFPKR